MDVMRLAQFIGKIFSRNRPIQGFYGPYRFLSNFWSVDVSLDGTIYPSVEHAYQAAKTLDPEWRKKILKAQTPGKAKRLGSKAPVRQNWAEIKAITMEDLVRQKFADPVLAKLLSGTGGRYIEETNHWNDTFWGVCNGEGENHLGRILMRVREDIREPNRKN